MARKSKPASMITGNDVSPEILKLREEQEQDYDYNDYKF